jgi:hypothetical protein
VPISWAIVDQHLACDDAGEPFLQSIAERDYAEAELLPDHELEHTLDQESDIAGVAASVLARASRSCCSDRRELLRRSPPCGAPCARRRHHESDSKHPASS